MNIKSLIGYNALLIDNWLPTFLEKCFHFAGKECPMLPHNMFIIDTLKMKAASYCKMSVTDHQLTLLQLPIYLWFCMKHLQPLPSSHDISFWISYKLVPLFLVSSSTWLNFLLQCWSIDVFHYNLIIMLLLISSYYYLMCLFSHGSWP